MPVKCTPGSVASIIVLLNTIPSFRELLEQYKGRTVDDALVEELSQAYKKMILGSMICFAKHVVPVSEIPCLAEALGLPADLLISKIMTAECQ